MSQTVSLASLLAVLSRRGLPAAIVFIAAVVSAYLFAREIPPRYMATSRLILDGRQSSVSELGQRLTEPSEFGGSVNPIATQAELVVSQRVLELTHNSLEAAGIANAAEQFPLSLVRENLSVSILPATNILKLTFTGSDPHLTAVFLNHLAEAVVEENVETTRSQATSVRRFLEDRLPKLQARLRELEKSEQNYREQTGIVSLPEQTRSAIDGLAELQERERSLIAQIEETSSRIGSLRQVTDVNSLAEAYATVRVGQDEDLRRLRSQLTELEIRYIEGRSRLGDRHPELLSIQDQLTDLRWQYFDRLSEQLPGYTIAVNPSAFERTPDSLPVGQGPLPSAAIASDELSQSLISDFILSEVRLSALNEHLKRLKAEQIQVEGVLAKLPQQQQFLAQLLRQQKETSVSLEVLQRKFEEARIAEAQLVSLVRVIDRAIDPASKSWPNLPVIIVLAAVSGTMLAVGTVVLLELLDDKVRDPDDIRTVSGLPILGSVLRLSPRKLNPSAARQLLLNQDYVETYRRALKNIECSTRKQSNCIVISSIQAEKTESTIATALAIVAAGLSRKTLLIDASLRQPARGKAILGLSAGLGVSDVINGELKFDRAIQATSIKNLSVLPAGSPCPNPAALVESKAMKKLLEKAAAEFEWVIVSAPSSEWSDVVTLGQHSNGVALMAAPRVTLRTRLETVTRELRSSNVPLLGIIVNAGKVGALGQPNWHRKTPPTPPPYAVLLSRKSAEPNLSSLEPQVAYLEQPIDLKALESLSDSELEIRVTELEQALDKLRPFVADQEMELGLQQQSVEKLARYLQSASESSRPSFAKELEEERDRYLLLEGTLVGQRRTLKAREALLAQYQQALQRRKRSLLRKRSGNGNRSIGLGPLSKPA